MVPWGLEEWDGDGSSGAGWLWRGCWRCRKVGAEAGARGGNALWMWLLAHICAVTQQAFTADLCTLREHGW